jgi:FdhD protein
MPRTARAATIEEVPLWLEANAEIVAQWSGTPNGLEALAAGRLLTLGYLRSASELTSLEVVRNEPEGTIGVRVRLSEAAFRRGAEQAQARRESRLGSLAPVRAPARNRNAGIPEPAALRDLLRQLFQSAEARRGEKGGMHAAALSDGNALIFLNEDASRHNVTDRALGAALLAGARTDRLGLVLSARISGAIAETAAAGGLAWVASRSIPTTLALNVARRAGIHLIARAASPDAIVYRA